MIAHCNRNPVTIPVGCGVENNILGCGVLFNCEDLLSAVEYCLTVRSYSRLLGIVELGGPTLVCEVLFNWEVLLSAVEYCLTDRPYSRLWSTV